MKAADTLIAWNAIKDASTHWGPPGSLALGPLLQDHEGDWTAPYDCTGGAAYVARRDLKAGFPQQHQVMLDWYMLVYSYGLEPYLVHRAFLLIDEYQTVIKRAGLGPDRDELGHDPEVAYGRSVRITSPPVTSFRMGRGTHFWPMSEVDARQWVATHNPAKAAS